MLIIVTTEKGLHSFATAILINAIIYLVMFSKKVLRKDMQILTHAIMAATACSGTIALKSSGKSFASGSFPPPDP